MGDVERKTLELKELSTEGQLQAVISTFGRDRDGDVMSREAFANSNGKSIPMVWSHNWDMPVGKGTVSVGKDSATFTGQFFLETAAGQEAYKAVKAMGDLQEYSIGFQVKDADFEYQELDGKKVYTRTIKDLELFEASPVLVGAAYNTGTIAVKEAKHEDIHEQIKALKESHDASCDLGDDCPLHVKQPVIEDERSKSLRELEAVLGYRPLIAGKAE